MHRIDDDTLPFWGAFFLTDLGMGRVRPDLPMTSPEHNELRKLTLRVGAVSRGNLLR